MKPTNKHGIRRTTAAQLRDDIDHRTRHSLAANGHRGVIVDLSDQSAVRPALDELHDCWSATSRARLGVSRQRWFHPATLDLVDAIAAGEDLTGPLRGIGEARAGAGMSLEETLADLAVLAELVPVVRAAGDGQSIARVDTLRAASVVGTAWAETFYDGIVAPNCSDPMTGLATGTFLEARLIQLYRRGASAGQQPGRDHVLVVLQINCRDLSPFASIAQRIRAAGRFSRVLAGADTLALLEPTHAMVALVENTGELQDAVTSLQACSPGDNIWVEHLGGTAVEATALVRELATIPRSPTVAWRACVRHP